MGMRSRASTAVEEGVGMPDHPGKDLTLGALPCGAAKLLSESGPDPSEEKETTEREDPVRRYGPGAVVFKPEVCKSIASKLARKYRFQSCNGKIWCRRCRMGLREELSGTHPRRF